MGGVDPLDSVGWCEDSAGERGLALDDLNAIASQNDKAL
jgi:hypothetical protein